MGMVSVFKLVILVGKFFNINNYKFYVSVVVRIVLQVSVQNMVGCQLILCCGISKVIIFIISVVYSICQDVNDNKFMCG